MLAGCQQEQPVEDHEREEEAVEHGEVDGLPLGRLPSCQPGVPQRVDRDRDPAGARDCHDARRRDAGEQ